MGARGCSRSISSIGVASTTWLPYSPIASEIAPALRPSQRIGEPEKPGPTPVASTAGPDTRTSMRGPLRPDSAAITSMISTSNDEIAVPRITDRPVQDMPGRTSASGTIGSAADAGGAAANIRATIRRDRRAKRKRRVACMPQLDATNEHRQGGQVQSTLGEFQETQSEQAFALQNSKLLKVSLDQVTIQAKAGSMVAYQGQVAFEHAGSGGMSRMLKKAMTGEGTKLMKMSGTGEVFLADTAQEIHLLYLENDAITVNGSNLLAFDAGIDWDIKKVEGASGFVAGGLFNTALQGTGWVAIVSDGPPVLLQHRRRAHVRRPAGGDHLGLERPDRHQDRHQDEELHRDAAPASRFRCRSRARAGCSSSRARDACWRPRAAAAAEACSAASEDPILYFSS